MRVTSYMVALVGLLAGRSTFAEQRRTPGTVLPPTLQRQRVALVRRPGCREYEKVAEEFKARVRAAVWLLPPQRGLGTQLARLDPHLILLVGQSAYDQAREAGFLAPRTGSRPLLIHTLVFHGVVRGPREVALAGRASPSEVLAAFRLARPGLQRVAVLHGPRSRAAMDEARTAASALGFTLYPIEAPSPTRAIALLRQMNRQAQGLWLLTDLDLLTPQVLQYALGIQFRRKVVLMGATRRHAEHGALLALDYEPTSLGREAADIANQLLAGVQRRRITVVGAITRLCVNQGTARTLRVPLSRLKAAGAEMVP